MIESSLDLGSGGKRSSVVSRYLSSSSAAMRFLARDRLSLVFAATPVARWVSKTAFSVLLRFCPPAPEPRYLVSSHCVSRTWSVARKYALRVSVSTGSILDGNCPSCVR